MCNWMVSTGVVGAMMCTPCREGHLDVDADLVFFYMGFEHSIVNMFLFPSGLMLGGNFTLVDYFLWNEIPTVVGNLVGGPAFVGATLYATHHRTSPSRRASTVAHNPSPVTQNGLLPAESPSDECLV
jgi:formate/nitrite transporter FocA (FNT family)